MSLRRYISYTVGAILATTIGCLGRGRLEQEVNIINEIRKTPVSVLGTWKHTDEYWVRTLKINPSTFDYSIDIILGDTLTVKTSGVILPTEDKLTLIVNHSYGSALRFVEIPDTMVFKYVVSNKNSQKTLTLISDSQRITYWKEQD